MCTSFQHLMEVLKLPLCFSHDFIAYQIEQVFRCRHLNGVSALLNLHYGCFDLQIIG
jgi:hypothetical protein